MRFSERYPFRQVREIVQIDSVDEPPILNRNESSHGTVHDKIMRGNEIGIKRCWSWASYMGVCGYSRASSAKTPGIKVNGL